jgi:chromosome segregation ATPase
MEEKKKTAKNVCPICGRFTSEKAINKYQRMVTNVKQSNEALLRERTVLAHALDKAEAENHRLQRALAIHEQAEGTLHKTVADQAKHITGLDAEVRMAKADAEKKQEVIEKLYARSLWQRILNIIPE